MARLNTFTRWAVPAFGVLLAMVSDKTVAADPFALLFGEPAPTTAPSDRGTAHEDNIRLVGVRLRDYPLIDVASAYVIADGLCLEAEIVFEALTLPLTIDGDTLSGWVGTVESVVDVDLLTATGTVAGDAINWADGETMETPQGWCLSLSVLAALTKIDFEYQASTLQVIARPRGTLPIEAKLERARLREQALASANISAPLYRVIETPYHWLSVPTADVVLDMDTRRASGLTPTVSVEAAGDLLKMTTRMRSVEDSAGGRQFRMNLGRTSEQPDQLGPLKARHFAMGHISAPAQPLTVRSSTGLGAIISNSPNYRPNLFDQTEIIGALPLGWEAELYQDDQLIAFTDTPDPNGNYRFEDVPLMLGYNRLTVKLFGPFGEVDQRVVTRFVGGTQCPDGEWRYSVVAIQPDQTRTNADDFGLDLDSSADPATEKQRRLLATIEHGLNKRLSVRLDSMVDFDAGTLQNSVSLFGSFNRVYGGVRMASDGRGMPALETFAQARISDATSLSFQLTEYGDLESEYAGQGTARLARQGRVRLETRLSRRFGYLPLRNTVIWTQRETGEMSVSANNVVRANYKGVNWSHSLAYTASETGEGLEGGLIASRNIRGARIRAGLNYGFANGPVVKTISMSAQRDIAAGTLLQGSSSYDMKTGDFGAETVLTKAFTRFMASARAGMSQNGDWHAGLNLAFSLHKPQDKSFYRMAPPGLSRMGGIRLVSYVDKNNDGVFGPDEVAVPGMKYMVDNSLRSEIAGSDGVNLISGIDPHRLTSLELQLSSVDDPFLKPRQTGRRLSVRPGQIVSVPIALLPTGDVDGAVQLQRGEHLTPLAGVTIEIIDADGRVMATTQSEYDGYFYADGIPVGAVEVRIAPDDLIELKADANPVTGFLSTQAPSLTDLTLTIVGE